MQTHHFHTNAQLDCDLFYQKSEDAVSRPTNKLSQQKFNKFNHKLFLKSSNYRVNSNGQGLINNKEVS